MVTNHTHLCFNTVLRLICCFCLSSSTDDLGKPIQIDQVYVAGAVSRLRATVALVVTLRKQAYSNALKILPPKNDNFSDKKF